MGNLRIENNPLVTTTTQTPPVSDSVATVPPSSADSTVVSNPKIDNNIYSGMFCNNVNYTAKVLQDAIKAGNDLQIVPAFNEFLQAFKLMYDPENKIDNKTLYGSAYENYTRITGEDLFNSIKENTSNSFITGFVNTFTLGFSDKISKDELIEQISNGQVKNTNKKWEKTGKAVSHVAQGATIGAATGATLGGVTALPGALIGAGVGVLYDVYLNNKDYINDCLHKTKSTLANLF
jgi:hypothetical protein